ncbi:MAG: hypothetical protein AABZ02_05275, partial [Bacteroidota bacterium]
MLNSIRRRIAEEMTGAALPFVAFCIALNLTVGQITALLKIPIYLDSIGTVLVAVLVGPWSAVICGSFANLLASAFGHPSMMFFIPVVVVIGAFTGYLARRGWFRRWYLVVPGGILQGVLAAIVSAPISAYLFSGMMMAGTDFLVIYFRSMGNTLLNSVFYQGLASDPVDKLVTYLLVFFLTRSLPRRLVSRLRGASNIQQSQSL